MLLELAHQPLQLAELPHQLNDALHGVAAALAGVVGQGLDAEHAAVYVGGDLGLLLHRLGYLAAAGGHLQQAVAYLLQHVPGGGGLESATGGEPLPLCHGLLRIPGATLQQGNHLLDLAGGGLSLDGQGADLVRHHREAATRLASPGGLDGGVEGQQVGLVGDVVDDVQDAVDGPALAGQRLYHGAGGDQLAVHSFHRRHGIKHTAVALPEQIGGLVQPIGGGGRAVGDLADGLRHLGDGGRHLVGLGLLLLQVVGDGLGVVQIRLGGCQDLLAGLLGAGQHRIELRLIHLHGELDGGEAIDPACVDQLHQGVVEAAAGQGLQPREAAREGLVDGERQHQGEGAEEKGPARAVLIAEGHQSRQTRQQAESERERVGEGGQAQGPRGLAAAYPLIDSLRALLHCVIRRRAHRLVLHHLAARILDGGHEGIDPVVIPVLAAVLDRAHPALLLAQVGPHVGEGLGRHVGVADQVVR
ncbi:hypothetical protein D3C71_794590 [compost metagenome]